MKNKISNLNEIENPTLEDILIALDGGKKEPIFLSKVKRDKDGSVITPFTAKGAKLYNDLVALLYAVGRASSFRNHTAEIVEELDDIADRDF